MRYKLRVIWYYIEIGFCKILNLLRIERDTSVIPVGHYCYVLDEKRNAELKNIEDGYYVIPCKYYRWMKNHYAGCTYVGFIGYDICLGDQCKMCGENYGDDLNNPENINI